MSKDDDVWRAIVDNYGERPDIELDEPASEPRSEPGVEAAAEPRPAEPEASWDDPYPDSDWATERFVPPPPPPLPTPSTDRLAAWVGVFGAPAVLLLSLVLGIDLPQLVAYLLVASFVGGFLYLVVQMPRGPRDPNDDGAQI